MQSAKQNVEESKKQKRAKYSGAAATRREKLNTSASPLEQPVVSAKTYEDGQRQRSTSANNQANCMRRSSSTNQSASISLAEQIRLSNLQKAKKYGNRMSSQNRNGLLR